MKKAVFYGRFSSDRQTEQSIEGQRTVCQKYANDNDTIIVDEYIDRAMTGRNDNRPAFQKMLRDSQKADWDFVLVYAVDRFGRNAIEVAINKQRLKKTSKTFISATQITSDNVDGTQNLNGILLENLYIGMAEYYSAELSQKIRRGMSESRMKGQTTGGTTALGYQLINKKYIVNEATAPIIVNIFESYSNSKTVKQITNEINEKGFVNQFGRPLSYNAVFKILRNDSYNGVKIIDNEEHFDIMPRIVDAELYKKVQNELKKNLTNPNRKVTNGKYLLTGKLFCGYCKRAISADSGTGKHGESHHYYKCSTLKREKGECEKNTVKRDWLENIVAIKTIEALKIDGLIEAIAKQSILLHNKMLRENTELISLNEQLKNTQKLLNNILKAVEDGITSKTIISRLKELEKQKEALEYAIHYEKSKDWAFLTQEQIEAFLHTFLDGEPTDKLFQEKLLDIFISKVELFNDKIIIFYNFSKDKKIDDISDIVYENSGSSYSTMVEVRGVEPLS